MITALLQTFKIALSKTILDGVPKAVNWSMDRIKEKSTAFGFAAGIAPFLVWTSENGDFIDWVLADVGRIGFMVVGLFFICISEKGGNNEKIPD